jgi:DNA-binding beta-propeller fold protein YncE
MRTMLFAFLIGPCSNGRQFSNGDSADPVAIVQAIRLAGASVTSVSDETRGTGPTCNGPAGVVLDAARNRVLVIQNGVASFYQWPWTLFAFDLATGNRTIVSGEAHGVGPLPVTDLLYGDGGIAIDPPNDRVFVAGPAYFFEVDLATGDRTEISGASVGSGPALQVATGIALDLVNGRAFLADSSADAVIAVDLATGDRTVFAEGLSGSTNGLTSLVLDAAGNRLLVTDMATDSIHAIDLLTGDTTLFSGAGTGAGTPFTGPRDLVLDPARGRALVLDSELAVYTLSAQRPQILSVNLATGNRGLVKTLDMSPRAGVLDDARDRVLVVGVR